jgi:acyl-CoA synthetase (NDP forming)
LKPFKEGDIIQGSVRSGVRTGSEDVVKTVREEALGGAFADVTPLLAPSSVAVIGASDQPGNVGGACIRFFRKFNSPCTVYPINPNRQSVAGLSCYPNLDVLPSVPDLAILAVPAAAVPGVVRDCAAVGIRAGIVWAGGFEGTDAGIARQAELVALCQETGFAVLGPNCLGIIDTHAPFTASFASMMLDLDRLLAGNISMVSQSGGLATIAQAISQQNNYGFRYMISVGNEAILGVADFIAALAQDPETKVILTYLEGVRDGAKFRRALEVARAAGKPVIVLKAGVTVASAIAAAAHTGALAGAARVWQAVLSDTGAIQVDSLEELLDFAFQLSGADLEKRPQGPGVAVITFGGGSGVLAADQCDRAGLSVPALTTETRETLAHLVPPIASTRNPVDLTPQVYLDPQWLPHFPKALDVIAADRGVGTVLFQLGPMSSGDVEMAQMVAAFRARCPKPVLVAWPLAIEAAKDSLRTDSVHVFPEYSRAIRALGRLAANAEATAVPRAAVTPAVFDWAAHVPHPADGLVISEHDCHAILERAGLPVAAGRLTTSTEEAIQAAEEVSFPVALKGISAAVTHRAAAGLLALSLKSPAEVREAWHKLQSRAATLAVTLDGLYVQPMVTEGVEILVSAFRDRDFGVMLSLGAGGIMTELIDDAVVLPAPLDAAAAARGLNHLRIIQRAGGISNHETALPRFIADFSALAASAPWRGFILEVNPLKWAGEQVTAVDGLLILEKV